MPVIDGRDVAEAWTDDPWVRACQWIADCMHWRGVLLTGKFSHWCWDWDGLPVDETCDGEWDCCTCWSPEELGVLLGRWETRPDGSEHFVPATI